MNNKSPATDGGWGWFVCLAGFMSNVIVDGTVFSFGVLFPELLRAFGRGKCETALVGSVMVGTHLFVGPITSALINAYGVRLVTIAGALLMTLSFILSTLAPSLTVLTITYGIIGGVGIGMVFISSILAVGFYFNKRRALANGIASSGSGIGIFLYAPLCIYLQENYSWRGTLFILAAVNLNCVVCGTLMRPLTSDRTLTSTRVITKDRGDDYLSVGLPAEKEPLVQILLNNRPMSLDILNEDNATDMKSRRFSTPVLHNNNNNNTSKVELLHRSSAISLNRMNTNNKNNESGLRKTNTREINGEHLYTGSYSKLYSSQLRLEKQFTMNAHGAVVSHADDTLHDNKKERGHFMPMKWLMKVPRERRLLYSLFVASSVLWPTQSSVMTILPDYAMLKGYTKEEAASLISIVGLTNTIGRIVIGLAADRPEIRAITLNASALVVGALTCVALSLTDSLALLMLEAGVFGICMATWCSLRPIVLVDLLGIGHLTNSLGSLVLFQGIAFYVGAPIAGYIYDTTSSYQYPFLLSSASFLLSGFISLMIHYLDKSPQIS